MFYKSTFYKSTFCNSMFYKSTPLHSTPCFTICPTNQIPGYVAEAIVVSPSTGAVGENATFAKKGLPSDTPMLHPESARRCGRSPKESRCTRWSGNPRLRGTQPRRSRHPSLRGERTSPPSVLWLQSHYRCRGKSDTHFLCAETDEEEETVSFHGPDCTSHFFDWLGTVHFLRGRGGWWDFIKCH